MPNEELFKTPFSPKSGIETIYPGVKPQTKLEINKAITRGSASCMAAIAASDAALDLDITILEKVNIRRSGTLATGMDALNKVAVPGL